MQARHNIRLKALTLVACLGLAWTGTARAQGWPSADCQYLLKAPQPTPVWGTLEKPDQTTMLIMLNYQMAVSLCQQAELIKAMQDQNVKISRTTGPLPIKTVAPILAPASTAPMAEAIKEALLATSPQGLPAATNASTAFFAATKMPKPEIKTEIKMPAPPAIAPNAGTQIP